MIKVAWDARFEVGHERIDFEHKIFLGLIREASLLPERDVSRERVLMQLSEVRQYAVFHFISEQNIMFDVRYPERELHTQEHEMLLALLDNRIHRYRAEESNLDQVVDFMFEWFALHTTQVDPELAAYIALHRGEAANSLSYLSDL